MFDHDELNGFMKKAEGAFSDQEKKLLGIGAPDEHAKRADLRKEFISKGVANGVMTEAVRPLQGKESDSDIRFYFEDWEDAQTLYDVVLDTGLVVPGEVKIKHIEGQNIVLFASSVPILKPEVIEGAMMAFGEIMADDGDNEEEYEELATKMSDFIAERVEAMQIGEKVQRGTVRNFKLMFARRPSGTSTGKYVREGVHEASKTLANLIRKVRISKERLALDSVYDNEDKMAIAGMRQYLGDMAKLVSGNGAE